MQANLERLHRISALCAILLVLSVRLSLLQWNRAEFTDSIMQISLFSNHNRYFPPLYTLSVLGISSFFKEPIVAGRFIAVLASGGTSAFVYLLARRRWGSGAALAATLISCSQPIAWRWSLHAMGDSLFTFLFLGAVYVFLAACSSRKGGFSSLFSRALFLGGLATLTRYQGLALLPVAGLILVARSLREGKAESVSIPAFAPWAALALWIGIWGMEHTEQFAGRADQSLGSTATIYLGMSFAFLRYLPCAVGIVPLFLIFAGVASGLATRGDRVLTLSVVILFLVWLLVHAAFQSFQYRYLLPMIPLFAIAGGVGCVWLAGRLHAPWLAAVLIAGAVLEGGWLSTRVLSGTRNTFADLRGAAEYVKSQVPDGAAVYSNEIYNRRHPYPVKMRFWSRRKVECARLGPDQQGRLRLFPIAGSEAVRPCIFCWHNVYSTPGLPPGTIEAFATSQGGKVLKRFEFENIPRLPDIMVTRDPRSGGTITSWPLAMEYREIPQIYRTLVIHLP